MFYNDNDEETDSALNTDEFLDKKTQDCTTYERALKDLIHDEQQYIKDLNLLIHVFRRALDDAIPKSKVGVLCLVEQSQVQFMVLRAFCGHDICNFGHFVRACSVI